MAPAGEFGLGGLPKLELPWANDSQLVATDLAVDGSMVSGLLNIDVDLELKTVHDITDTLMVELLDARGRMLEPEGYMLSVFALLNVDDWLG